MGREDEIKLIAYAIWEEASCPDGRDCEHWLMAETIWEQRGKSGAAASEGAARAPKKAPGRTAKAEATGKTSRKTRS